MHLTKCLVKNGVFSVMEVDINVFTYEVNQNAVQLVRKED